MNLGKMDGEFITIACSLEDQDTRLLDIGTMLAKKLAKRLKLVHVVEPWMGNYVGMPVGIVPPLWATNKEVMDAQIDDAEKKLRGYTGVLDPESDATIRIHAGDPAKWILAEAQDSALTLIGSGEFDDGVFKRLTTAFQVLSQAEKPVLIVPEKASLPKEGALRILFADDLEDHTLNAADFIFRLSTKLEPVDLQHVHVSGLSVENLEAGIEMAQATAHASSAMPKASDLYQAARESLAKSMADRISVSQAEFSVGGNCYDQVILEGNPSERLQSFREEFKPQIEVFGKHHALHRKTFTFGRMPFQSMLTGDSLVIVVPS